MALRRDPLVATIVVEHWDRLARFGAGREEAALAAQGGSWWCPSEVETTWYGT